MLLWEVRGAPSGNAAFLRAPLPAPTTQCCCPLPGLRLEPPVGVCCTPWASGCWWMRSCRAQRVPGLAPASLGQSAAGTGAVLALAPSTAQSGRGRQAGAGKSLRFIKRHFELYKRGLPTQPGAGAGPGRTSQGQGQGEPATLKASLQTNQPSPQEKNGPRDNGEELPEGKLRRRGTEASPQGPSPAGSPQPMGTPWCHPAGAGHAAAAGAEWRAEGAFLGHQVSDTGLAPGLRHRQDPLRHAEVCRDCPGLGRSARTARAARRW